MFGQSTEAWTRLKIMSKDKTLFIFVNGEEIRTLPLEITSARFIGFRFRFEGTGFVKDVFLNDQVVF